MPPTFQPRPRFHHRARVPHVVPIPPPPPPGPPAVVSTAFSGNTVNLVFDQPVVINGNPPDESVRVNGVFPSSVGSADANTLWLGMPDSVSSGDPWAISAQPAWIDTVIAVPQSGVL